jgi:hypothetical protein
MLYSEIIAVCSEIHTKHINTMCGQNVEFVNVKHSGTYSNHWASWAWRKTPSILNVVTRQISHQLQDHFPSSKGKYLAVLMCYEAGLVSKAASFPKLISL